MTDAEILDAVERYSISLTRSGPGGLWRAGTFPSYWAADSPRGALELAIRHCRYEDDPLGRYTAEPPPETTP